MSSAEMPKSKDSDSLAYIRNKAVETYYSIMFQTLAVFYF